MRLENLQAAARELPQHQPTEAQRTALRTSLVEAARAERPAPRRRRVGGAIALGGGLAAAAALAVWWTGARSATDGEGSAAAPEVGARRATIQSSSGAHFEHTRVFGPVAGDAPPVADEVVRLRQGRVAVAVEHLEPGERFRVVTGDAEVEVRGTSFDVIVEDDRLIEVVVHTGLVEVRPDGEREMIALRPGERWRADQHPVRTAALEPTAAEPANLAAPSADLPAPSLPASPDVPAPPPAAADPVSTRHRAPAAARLEHGGPGLERQPRADALSEPKALPVPDGPPAAEADAPAEGAAATEEEAPRPAQPPVPTASEMAFGRGFRALRRGNYGEAAEQFESAIASGPGSALVDDARYWRAVALARSGQTGTAREALGEFLQLHARSPRAGEASVMLGWMLLEAGDRTGAFRRFKAAAGDRDPAVRASAEKGLAKIRQH